MSIRDKLSPRDVKLLKLAVWTCLVVWMVFFTVISLSTSFNARWNAESWYPVEVWGNFMGPIMRWVIPIWIVFTNLLIVILIARLVKRKLS